MARSLIPLVLFVGGLWFADTAVARLWTDASGQEQMEAEFITLQGGRVWLLRADGRLMGVEPAKLSQADQAYVREMVRTREATRRLTENPPGRVPYGPGRALATLANPRINESSGIARSLGRPGWFWTHNDSGDAARIYLFDIQGRDLGSCELQDIVAYDFEDMFAARLDGRNLLVIGDVGNNGRVAPIQVLYVIEEPALDPRTGVKVASVPVLQTIFYSYEDDYRDCEAVGLDPTSRTILLVSRESEPTCFVYALAWPDPGLRKAASAKRIATLSLPPVSALDVSPDGLRAVVLTYAHAYEYVRAPEEDWSEAFARPPREIIMPERIQGESVCFGDDGKTLFLTSEKRPTPLFVVPAVEGRGTESASEGVVE